MRKLLTKMHNQHIFIYMCKDETWMQKYKLWLEHYTHLIPNMNDDNSISARCTVCTHTHIVYGVLVKIDDFKSKLFYVHSN